MVRTRDFHLPMWKSVILSGLSLRKFAQSESESFIGANVKMSTELTEYQRLIKSALEDVKGIEVRE